MDGILLKGDLDNRLSPTVGMRFENTLSVFGKLNKPAKAYLEKLTNLDSLNVIVITTGSKRKAMAFCTKWAIPYKEVVQADTLYEVPDLCREHGMIAYYDSDTSVIEDVVARRGNVNIEAIQWTQFENLK